MDTAVVEDEACVGESQARLLRLEVELDDLVVTWKEQEHQRVRPSYRTAPLTSTPEQKVLMLRWIQRLPYNNKDIWNMKSRR